MCYRRCHCSLLVQPRLALLVHFRTAHELWVHARDDPSEVSELMLCLSKTDRLSFELFCVMDDVGTAYVRNLLHNVADQVRMPAYQSLGIVAAACSSSCQFCSLSLGSARAESWNKDRFHTSVGMATGSAPNSCSCVRAHRGLFHMRVRIDFVLHNAWGRGLAALPLLACGMLQVFALAFV